MAGSVVAADYSRYRLGVPAKLPSRQIGSRFCVFQGTIAHAKRKTDGEIRRNSRLRVLRKGAALHEGNVTTLKHLQEDVREVKTGFDCGISTKGFDTFEVGDILEAFIVEKVAVA